MPQSTPTIAPAIRLLSHPRVAGPVEDTAFVLPGEFQRPGDDRRVGFIDPDGHGRINFDDLAGQSIHVKRTAQRVLHTAYRHRSRYSRDTKRRAHSRGDWQFLWPLCA